VALLGVLCILAGTISVVPAAALLVCPSGCPPTPWTQQAASERACCAGKDHSAHDNPSGPALKVPHCCSIQSTPERPDTPTAAPTAAGPLFWALPASVTPFQTLTLPVTPHLAPPNTTAPRGPPGRSSPPRAPPSTS